MTRQEIARKAAKARWKKTTRAQRSAHARMMRACVKNPRGGGPGRGHKGPVVRKAVRKAA